MGIQVVILEGTRGGGKSSVAQGIRRKTWGSTLLNLTGFEADGPEGLEKIKRYYQSVLAMLELSNGQDFLFIFDRIFFSEMVYSKLYKSYDFSEAYEIFCHRLLNAADKVHVVYLTADAEALAERLNRDKALLFDQVDETVEESLKQQAEYNEVIYKFKLDYAEFESLNFKAIDTSKLSIEEVQDQILQEIRR